MKSNEKFTQRAENAIENALAEAAALGHSCVGSEHLLLGILAEKDSAAARLLLRVCDEAVALIASRGGGRYGARPLRRAVQSMVEDPAARLLLAGEAGGGVTLLADAAGERLVLRAEK